MKGYGCKHGLPHDLQPVVDGARVKWEVCRICSRKFRWVKFNRGRVHNAAYLKAHARNYAQPGGATNRLYQKIYHPEKCVIKL